MAEISPSNAEPALFWPVIETEDLAEASNNAAKRLVELGQTAFEVMFRLVSGYYELPPIQRLLTLQKAIERFALEQAVQAEMMAAQAGMLAAQGQPVPPEMLAPPPVEDATIGFFKALEAIDGAQAAKLARDYRSLVLRYARQGQAESRRPETTRAGPPAPAAREPGY